jgi:hypothetical protein
MRDIVSIVIHTDSDDRVEVVSVHRSVRGAQAWIDSHLPAATADAVSRAVALRYHAGLSIECFEIED